MRGWAANDHSNRCGPKNLKKKDCRALIFYKVNVFMCSSSRLNVLLLKN